MKDNPYMSVNFLNSQEKFVYRSKGDTDEEMDLFHHICFRM